MSINTVIDLFLHLDKHLNLLLSQYSIWAYVILFLIIFIETGVVIMPFLPGDSLIFATAAIAAAGGQINPLLILVLFYLAAISGDTLNYHIGHLLRKKINNREKMPLIKMEHIDRTQFFFEKNGGKTITIARFIPIIRTFAPFIAGVGEMPYKLFIGYNILGGFLWVSLMFSIGYFFGNISYIKNHFSLVVVAIVIISVMPAVVSYVKNKAKKKVLDKE